MADNCAHHRLERDYRGPGCQCSMCENDGYRILDCSDCCAMVTRDGDENFDTLWDAAPWWYDVDVSDVPLMSAEEFHTMMSDALVLPEIQIKRGGIKWPTNP